jgi:hypothetical protein
MCIKGRSNIYIYIYTCQQSLRVLITDRPYLLRLHAWPALETLFGAAQAKNPFSPAATLPASG